MLILDALGDARELLDEQPNVRQEYPKNSGPLMAVFFGSSPEGGARAVTRRRTSAHAAVADFATMGPPSRPSSALSRNIGPSSPSTISCVHFVLGPLGSSQRMYWRELRYPTGRTYAAEW